MRPFTELRRRNVFRVAIAYGVVAWFIIQAADIMLANFGAPGWVFKTVAGLLALGFPLALFLSWAYELTPEGVKKSADVAPAESATPKTGKRIDRLILIALLGVIAILIVERLWFAGGQGESPAVANAPLSESGAEATGDTPMADTERSIAVRPFADLSPDGDQEYFSDGLAEEIPNLLAAVRDLSVASRTSAFSFKGSGLPIPGIAGRLGVKYVLEGSVRKSGERIRVTAQLIDAERDRHLWSENYDRTLDDIFAIQDEIISTRLYCRLSARCTRTMMALCMRCSGPTATHHCAPTRASSGSWSAGAPSRSGANSARRRIAWPKATAFAAG